MDEGKQIRLTSVEVLMRELDSLIGTVSTDDALVEGGDLAKTVEVQLTDEGREVLVLEPFPKDFTSKLLVIIDCENDIG